MLAKGRSFMKKEDDVISAIRLGILGKPIRSYMVNHQIGKGKNLPKKKEKKKKKKKKPKECMNWQETQSSIEPSLFSREQLGHLYK